MDISIRLGKSYRLGSLISVIRPTNRVCEFSLNALYICSYSCLSVGNRGFFLSSAPQVMTLAGFAQCTLYSLAFELQRYIFSRLHSKWINTAAHTLRLAGQLKQKSLLCAQQVCKWENAVKIKHTL